MGSALRVSNPNQWAPTVERLHSHYKASAAGLITAFNEAVFAGEILTQVKGALRHGEWLPWIEEYAPFSQRTAWDFMSAFERQAEIRPKLEANANLNWRSVVNAGSNGSIDKPQQLHESNFYFHSIKLTQRLMGDINHEIKDHPLETWQGDKIQSLAAALEPAALLYDKLKSMLE
jgi:hypothetical protein